MVKIESESSLKLTIKWDEISDRGQSLYRSVVGSVEKEIILDALKRAENIQTRAARILGINRNTLRTKIKKLGIRIIKNDLLHPRLNPLPSREREG